MSIFQPVRAQRGLRFLPACRRSVTPIEATPAPPAARVSRHGGSQLLAPQVHLVFDADFPHPERYIEWHLYHCLTGLVSGSFAQGLRQYGAGPGVYAGYATPSFPSGSIGSTGLEDWLRTLLMAPGAGKTAPDQLFMLFPSPRTVIGDDGFVYGVDWCAYHGSVQLPAAGEASALDVAYAVVPYPTPEAWCGQSLGLSDLDILTVLASHELAEAMTDAVPGQGWEGDDGEIDDFAPCLWRPIEVRFDGMVYKIQAYWDERAGRCWRPTAESL
jgi:hypothetical protein